MNTNDSSGYSVFLFEHTKQGAGALEGMLLAGVDQDTIAVIGDLGPPAGEPGAQAHGTFDGLHLPLHERPFFMNTIRSGGVVLAIGERSEPGQAGGGTNVLQKIAVAHGALRTLRTSPADHNPSHNPKSS